MSWLQFSIRRPVTTVMVYLGVVLLGLIAWTRLPQELFPPITYPQLTIVTHYKDAAPEEIELLVTKPIEEVAGTVSGLRRISSISKEELSLVIAEFNWDTNMDFAGLGVREKIDLIKEKLPRGSEEPVVIKYNPFELPVLVLNLTGDVSPHELLTLARKQLKNEIEKVEGVAAVNISGGLEREILVEVDQGRLQAANMPISHVVDGLSRANLNYPAGTIKEAFYEYLIRTIGEFSVVKEIPGIAVSVDEQKEDPEKELQRQQRESLGGPLEKEKGLAPRQRLVLLKDVAVVKDTFRDPESISRYNGRDNVSLSIQKQAGANTLQLAKKVKEEIQQIQLSLPPGVKITIAYDQSIAISNAINGVLSAVTQGGALAFLALFLILGSFWAALNVSMAIPISVLATIAIMYFSGMTVNVISLGGLALGIGMLVDAGIVVVENISRYREMGRPPAEAAVTGTGEVASAIFGSTLTTVVVFLPMVFVVGITGQLFKDLGYTVILSLLASLVVSMTLTLLFASRIRSGTETRSLVDPLLKNLYQVDLGLVRWFLNNRLIGTLIMAALLVVSFFTLAGLDRETLPRVDQGQFILRATLPPGTRLDATDKVAGRIERVLQAMPEVRDVTVTIGSSKEKRAEELLETLGSHQAQLLVNLWPRHRGLGAPARSSRVKKTSDLVQELKETLGREPLEGANIEYLLQESIFKSAFTAGAPVVVEVKGTDLAKIEKLAIQVKKSLEGVQGLYGVQTSMIPPSPETKVHVLKDRAATYHLSVSDIALTAQTAFKGFVATKFKEEGKEVDIRVRLRKQDRQDINKIRNLLIHSPLDVDVPLAEVAYLSVGKGPTEIRHLDQQRTIMVSAQLFRRSLGETFDEVNRLLAGLKVPSGYTAALTGENKQMQESFNSLAFALVLSVLLVYMVMAAVMESLWQPFLIMATIPMSLIGVALGLSLTQTPISVMSGLGFIVLAGVVVNNGIVMIEFINHERAQGMPLEEAVVQASQTRLRPILLTAGTTIAGLLPLSLGLQQGAELQIPMGITIMWGLAISTFLTLVYLPTVYVAGAHFFEQFPVFAPPPVEAAMNASPHSEPVMPAVVMAGVPVRGDPEQSRRIEPRTDEPPPAPAGPPPEFPEIPSDFGSEEAVPDKPDSPVFFPGGSMEVPEPTSPVEEPPQPSVRGELVEPRTEISDLDEAIPGETVRPSTGSGRTDEPPVEPPPEPPTQEPPAEPEPPPESPLEPPPEPPAQPDAGGEYTLPPITPPSLPSITPPSLPPVGFSPPPPPAPPPVEPHQRLDTSSAAGTVPPRSLNPRQEKLLNTLKKKGRITRVEYVNLTGASVPTAARDLKELVDAGLIKGVGPLAKGRYYVLA